jgi:hypothetical protein
MTEDKDILDLVDDEHSVESVANISNLPKKSYIEEKADSSSGGVVLVVEAEPSSSVKTSSIEETADGSSGGVVLVVEQQEPSSSDNTSYLLEISYFSSKPECTPLLPHQVSLRTQLSLDQMWIMKHQCVRWPVPQPISISVYLPHDDGDNRNETFVTDELERLGCDLSFMTKSPY